MYDLLFMVKIDHLDKVDQMCPGLGFVVFVYLKRLMQIVRTVRHLRRSSLSLPYLPRLQFRYLSEAREISNLSLLSQAHQNPLRPNAHLNVQCK